MLCVNIDTELRDCFFPAGKFKGTSDEWHNA